MNHAIRQAIAENVSYEQDSRVLARREAGKVIQNFDRQTITFVGIDYREDADDEGLDLTLPAKVEVCPTCGGRGKHVNPSIDAGGLSREDFYEDPDFADEYMSGRYDVACYECHGRNVTLTVDESRVSADDLAVLHSHWESERQSRSERLAEMRMGA